jgi:hypothetical protein
MKTIILLAIFGLLLIVSSSNAKNVMNDNDLEFSDKKARMFLRAMMGDDDDDLASFDMRQSNCVKCKFGIFNCCAPNFCKKKLLRPDECVEVKSGK